MRLKKVILLFAACIFTAAMFTGCGEDKKVEAPATVEYKIGMLRHMNSSEKDFNDFMKKVSEVLSLKMSTFEPIFFDNMTAMQMALDSKQINVMSTYGCVAEYITAKNPNIVRANDNSLEFVDSFCFAVRDSDKELLDLLNKAVKEMHDDGTLDKLKNKYIDNPEVYKNDISAVEIPVISGADTIKIAVTGDLPPLDYIDAEGKAAGYNTAVLADISRRINRNIELVQVESGARSAALSSGRADVSFWAIVPVSEIIPANADKPAGVELTAPYYKAKVAHVKLKE